MSNGDIVPERIGPRGLKFGLPVCLLFKSLPQRGGPFEGRWRQSAWLNSRRPEWFYSEILAAFCARRMKTGLGDFPARCGSRTCRSAAE